MKKRIKKILPVTAVALFLVAGGLETAFAQSQAGKLSRFEERIRHALVTLPYYSVFDNLMFKVEGSKVVLTGQVTRPTLKSDAGATVRRISDVESVDNQIRVLPVSSNDDRIRLEAYRVIYYHPNFTRYAIQAVPPIHIIVENGDLTLVGVVATEADKSLAGIRARQVPGAFSVTNKLVVERN